MTKEQQLCNHARYRVQTHKRLGEFSSHEKNIIYLETLIKSIKNDGNKPVLLTLPYYYDYNEGFGESWLNEHYYKYITLILEKYKIPYLNYSTDNRFEHHAELFYNSDHLGKEGAIYFSGILFSDLRNIGVFEE